MSSKVIIMPFFSTSYLDDRLLLDWLGLTEDAGAGHERRRRRRVASA
jgi:hypothetical protein